MAVGRSRVRGGSHARRMWAVCAMVLVAASAGCGGVKDRDLVRCLAPANRSAMVEAAVALGVATAAPGGTQVVVDKKTTMSLETWREKRADDFERTCTALPAPAAGGGGESSPWVAAIFALLAAIVGAIATAATTAHLAGTGRRRLAADQLNALATALRRESDAYVASWRGEAPKRQPTDAVAARRHLDEVLRTIGTEHPQWVLTEHVRDALATSRLTEDLKPGNLPETGRVKLLDDIEAGVDRAVKGAERLARAIRRPERYPLTLRRPLPDRSGPLPIGTAARTTARGRVP